eukprot:245954-Rhodomonas_salina.1
MTQVGSRNFHCQHKNIHCQQNITSEKESQLAARVGIPTRCVGTVESRNPKYLCTRALESVLTQHGTWTYMELWWSNWCFRNPDMTPVLECFGNRELQIHVLRREWVHSAREWVHAGRFGNTRRSVFAHKGFEARISDCRRLARPKKSA